MPKNIGLASKGSRYWLQVLVNNDATRLNKAILDSSQALRQHNARTIKWVSPLQEEDFLEYRDDFLQPLRVKELSSAVRDFWPKGGPQWDGLALVEGSSFQANLLVEAKAHVAETYSDMKAEGKSADRIRNALHGVQLALAGDDKDWTREVYQTANRIAFLYFMNRKMGLPTWLAFINFVNDPTHRSTGKAEWDIYYSGLSVKLGIPANSWIWEHVIVVSIDVGGIE